MFELTAVNGLKCIVDEDIYLQYKNISWSIRNGGSGKPYFRARVGNIMCSLHRLVILCKDGEIVDHINQNTLDNRRNNLRIATVHQNSINSGVRKHSTTGYKGVSVNYGKYVARIKLPTHRERIGTFNTAIEAARAYDKAVHKYHGEFASYNFPQDYV
jgi:hypothetical protein